LPGDKEIKWLSREYVFLFSHSFSFFSIDIAEGISMSHRREALEQDIKSLQSSFNEILTSGHHYFTQELAAHIKHINNALDNIKLDHEFQRGSKNWTKQFDANEIQSNELSKTLRLSFRTRETSFALQSL
jgi:hypothetical protein